jgi:hypothetical protein
MRRPWIKIETATADKPEICAIATRLRIDTDSVVGKLIRLWSWAEVNHVDGNDIGVTKEFIDKLVGRKGFAEALEAAGWLQTQGESLQFPNFERHNGNASKIRGQTAKRVERHRQRKPASPPQPVDEPHIDPPSIHPIQAPESNDANDVKNIDTEQIANDLTSEEITQNQLTSSPDSLPINNDNIVTKETLPLPLPSVGSAEDDVSTEADGSGKLPRLTKRSTRLPAEEDQPMLF